MRVFGSGRTQSTCSDCAWCTCVCHTFTSWIELHACTMVVSSIRVRSARLGFRLHRRHARKRHTEPREERQNSSLTPPYPLVCETHILSQKSGASSKGVRITSEVFHVTSNQKIKAKVWVRLIHDPPPREKFPNSHK